MKAEVRVYLIKWFSLVTALLGLCLSINLAIDPLWHFSGNQVGENNYGFNERLSKLNRARKLASEKNCVIYGSSRTTLLDENFIKSRNCLNMAVSQGLAEEFPYYAKHLKEHGLQADLVIIGADDLTFFSPPGNHNTPLYVLNGKAPPTWLQDYLSLDSLSFSIRALANKSPNRRYYQADFSIAIEEKPGRHYRPSPDSLALISLDQAQSTQGRLVYSEFLSFYRALIAEHPKAEIHIYIPPISLWRVGDMMRRGEIPDYLSSVHRLSDLGVPVWDYSVANSMTINPSLSYDGSHYDLASNQQIAHEIEQGHCEECLMVHNLSAADYQRHFLDAYQQHRKRWLAKQD